MLPTESLGRYCQDSQRFGLRLEVKVFLSLARVEAKGKVYCDSFASSILASLASYPSSLHDELEGMVAVDVQFPKGFDAPLQSALETAWK